jgi:hypothetical protein
MSLIISSTSITRFPQQKLTTETPSNPQRSLDRLIEKGETGGEVGALIAKTTIVNQAEVSLKAQANASHEVALSLLD